MTGVPVTSARPSPRRTYPFAHAANVDGGSATILAASATVYSGFSNLAALAVVSAHLLGDH